ncbi:MAG: hypothetical protein CFE24_06875 [Flavobacterium sp. BFFFF2]|nr:MAG: hypothetical protein CFE24_06875 [Flavobacterium sp. BFFFF2]
MKETSKSDFEILKKANLGAKGSKSELDLFLKDTTLINKYTDGDKVTYTLRIYPLFETLSSDKFYNLVYEKYGDQWNEIIFKNKLEDDGSKELQSSEMISNELFDLQGRSPFCETITYLFHCTGCTGESCDYCNACMSVVVKYEYCGSQNHTRDDLSNPREDLPSGFSPIGPSFYIPIPYQGDADVSNPDFMLAASVSGFIKTITDANFPIKQLLRAHQWIYPNLIDFIRQNGGLNSDNQNAIIFALTHLNAFFQHIPNDWDINQGAQYQFNTLMYLLHNPNTPQAQLNWLVNNPNAAAPLFASLQHDNSQENKDFVAWAVNYLMANPNVTWEEFKNWFLNRKDIEGDDTGITDIIDQNLILPQQPKPTFNQFFSAYPSHLDAATDTPLKIYTLVGGNVLQKYVQQGARNTCALRISKALNDSGVAIPEISGVTVKGADNKNYFLNVPNLLSFLKKTFGTPTGNNYLNSADCGPHGTNIKAKLNGKKGIYIMIPLDTSSSTGYGASGHADLYFDNNECDGSCDFNADGGVKEVYFWELP